VIFKCEVVCYTLYPKTHHIWRVHVPVAGTNFVIFDRYINIIIAYFRLQGLQRNSTFSVASLVPFLFAKR